MKNGKKLIYLFVFLLTVMMTGFITEDQALAAAKQITVHTVDYDNENIIINNNENDRIFFATDTEAAKDKWEVIEADAGDTTTIDFSWLSSNVDSVLKFKGDKNETQVSVTILGKTPKLAISISYAKAPQLKPTDTIGELLNIMTTAGTAKEPIEFSDLEWRKGSSGRWKDINELTKNTMQKLQIKGADLYFRIKAVNDVTEGTTHPDGTKGNRASNEVKLKIAKKAMAAVVGIDGSKFTAAISYGKEFRLTVDGQKTTDWVKITDKSVRKLVLEEMFGTFGYKADGINIPFPQVFIEIRNYATSKAASSKITEIELEEQRTLEGNIIEGSVPEDPTDEELKNIYVGYNGISNITLTIPLASTEQPYEYYVSKTGDFDITKAVWSTVTKGTSVKVLASKAVDGGYLYVRQKEIKYKEATRTSQATAYQMASTCKVFKLNYPALPTIQTNYLVHVRKYSENMEFNIITHKGNEKPFETKVSTIKIGSKSLNFEQQATVDNSGSTPVYGIKVTITKDVLNNMALCQNKPLVVTFANGTVNKTSLKITIKDAIKALDLVMDTPIEGTAVGTVYLKASLPIGQNNEYVYKITDEEVKNIMTADTVKDGTAFVSGSDITVAAGKYVTVYELNKSDKTVVKYRSILIRDEFIKK